MPQIHPTAIVAPGAKLGRGRRRSGPIASSASEVGSAPGSDSRRMSSSTGARRSARGTRIFPFASIGLEPQDLKYRGERSELVIGRDNTIREYVTMNPGTAGGGMVTRVGDHCLFMVGAHVAHDCQIGDHVDHGEQRDPRRPCRRRGLRRCSAACRAVHQYRPDRQARDDRRHVGGRARRHPLRPGDGRPRAAVRPQHHRHAAPRLQPRGHPGAAQRLPVSVLARRDAERPGQRDCGAVRRHRRRSTTSSTSSAPIRAAPSVSPKARMAGRPLGIMAGGGDLPRRLIEACRAAGRAVFVLALEGEADPPTVRDVPHAWCRLGAPPSGLSPAARERRRPSSSWPAASGARRLRRCGRIGARPSSSRGSAIARSAMTGCCRRWSRSSSARGFA